MNGTYFLRGVLLGLSVAAPVGPIGILCIRRTLAEGRLLGLATGLGAATADALYGGLAAFGMTFVATLLMSQHLWLHLLGGLFLCFLGVRAWQSRPAAESSPVHRRGLLTAYGTTVLLTLANPLTILSFAALFAGLGMVGTRGQYSSATLLTFGVFTGSCLWWLLLTGAVGSLRTRLDRRVLHWANRISGAVLVAFGLITLDDLRA
jgi:threonine/homoserine/homoserine lactone efflux protein